MMRSLFSGVSGLKGHQTRMDVIGNNIANVNAVGFKSSRVTFADTLSQTTAGASSPGETIGGTNPKQIGLGTGVASIDLLFTDGSVQSTGKNTDLCLSGNGLFVVKNGNETYYTRDGAFEFDAEGNYVLPGSGLFVQGWSAQNGELNTTGAVGNIQVKAGKSMAAAKSTSVDYENNLNSAIPTIKEMTENTIKQAAVTENTPTTITIGGTSYKVKGIDSDIGAGDWKVKSVANPADSIVITDGTNDVTCTLSETATNVPDVGAAVNVPVTTNITLSDDTKVTQSSGKYTEGNSLPITTTLTLFDSLGNAHAVTVYFVETDPSENKWKVTVGKDYTDISDPPNKASQTITEADGTTTTVTMTDVELIFDANGKFKNGFGTGNLELQNGSESPTQVSVNFSALTQYAGSNTVKGNADGNAAGTLKSISIDNSGVITGTYTNGLKQSEAQVAIAQFTNASGLTKTGSSLYQESNNSGTPNVKTAADLGVTITPSALEMSNVDIANEFSDMIITQRGFQSNSKVITVGDEMLETLINMKR
ncbi:flagellar hook protein FlgE [Selenomonas sp. AE3005]|uniref:flagellar hook protein FlgE n=1 Tax=Selenomonas sp. AE3005 TaxID=1485543 RepID=UPI00048301E9|nr:flagellar hook protein FlgE [Selenomonas sp. AE3005]